MNVRTSGVAAWAALALVATPAHAQEAASPPPVAAPRDAGLAQPIAPPSRDTGWNSKFGLLFQAYNIFQNSDFLAGYGGGVGLQYNLGPQRAIRVTADLSRDSSSIVKSDVSPPNAPSYSTETVPNPTSTYGVDLGAQYMMRLTPAALAPYIGVGAGASWSSSYRKGKTKDSRTPDNWTDYDWSSRTLSFGAVGTLGLEWRIHRALAIFAEYGLNVAIYESGKSDNETTVSNPLSTPVVQTTKTKSTASTFLNIDTGLNQGGQLGLVAFF